MNAIEHIVGGILAGLIAVIIFWFLTHTDADKAPLFPRKRRDLDERAIKPPRNNDSHNCAGHGKFYRSAERISPAERRLA